MRNKIFPNYTIRILCSSLMIWENRVIRSKLPLKRNFTIYWEIGRQCEHYSPLVHQSYIHNNAIEPVESTQLGTITSTQMPVISNNLCWLVEWSTDPQCL